MKKTLLFLLLLSGCGSAPVLTKAFCDGERARVDAYYDMRQHGITFDPSFYQTSDSIAKSLPPDNVKLLTAYSMIGRTRRIDSLNHMAALADSKMQIDVEFQIARGYAK